MILANVPAFYFGTSPNKFCDYIASGLPVVINYPGWLAQIIRENECGIYVPPEDPEKFADALELKIDILVVLENYFVKQIVIIALFFELARMSTDKICW